MWFVVVVVVVMLFQKVYESGAYSGFSTGGRDIKSILTSRMDDEVVVVDVVVMLF